MCEPSGTVAMANWTPDGGVGEFFDVFAAHAPAPSIGPPPVAWGSEAYLRTLFGQRVEWLKLERREVVIDKFASPEDFCAFYKANFGPTIAAYASVAAEPDRAVALDRDFLGFAATHGPPDAFGVPGRGRPSPRDVERGRGHNESGRARARPQPPAPFSPLAATGPGATAERRVTRDAWA